MALQPLVRVLNKSVPVFLLTRARSYSTSPSNTSPVRHNSSTRTAVNHRTICTRHFSSTSFSDVTSSAGVTSSDEHSDALADIKLHTRERKMIEEQAALFSDPEFFRTPVIMLHCQWTDFAVSFHAPDKLDEMDCLWSCFPSDLKIYGTTQRLQSKTVQLILIRAKKAMEKYGVTKCRIVIKGYNKITLHAALSYLQTLPFQFISITDLTRKFGEESVIYQRPVPRYPKYKMPADKVMKDGPGWAPKTTLDKFKKLNVKWLDKSYRPGVGLSIKSSDQKASKRGFINKTVQGKKN